MTATNPKTGERMTSDDGQNWRPIMTATNPKTGEKLESLDGGTTWGKVEARPPTPRDPRAVFGENVVKSAKQFGSDVAGAIPRIPAMIGAIPAALDEVRNKGVSMVGGTAPPTPGIDAAWSGIKKRYGSPRAAAETFFTDPVGMAADASTLAGGVGGALRGGSIVARGAGAGRAAAALTKGADVAGAVASATDPILSVGRGAAAVTRPLRNKVAQKMYGSALKIPPGSIDRSERLQRIQTGLDERIPATQGGLDEVNRRIASLNQQIDDMVKGGSQHQISPTDVAAEVAPTRTKFAQQATPGDDLATIDSTTKEFLDRHQVAQLNGQPIYRSIPVVEAQTNKKGTYARLKDKDFGEVKTASKEAQKALARGYRKQLERYFPEIAGLNKRDGRLIALEESLERFANQSGNRDLVSLGTAGRSASAGMLGAAGGGTEAAIAAAVVAAALDHPAVKSSLAIILSNPPQLIKTGAKAAGRAATAASRIPTPPTGPPAGPIE